MADSNTTLTPEDVKKLLLEFVTRERQTYVGMRYVPKFSEGVEWSASEQYEPLTMVTHNQAVYVSKFYVPIGVPVSNTEYWVMWGTFDDAIITTDMIADGSVTLPKLAASLVAVIPMTPLTNAEIDAITQ